MTRRRIAAEMTKAAQSWLSMLSVQRPARELGGKCSSPGSVGEAFAGLGVEDVDVLGVGGDVEGLALVGLPTAGDPDDDVARGALHVAGAVDELVGAQLLDHRDGDGKAALGGGDDPPRLRAYPDGDVGV